MSYIVTVSKDYAEVHGLPRKLDYDFQSVKVVVKDSTLYILDNPTEDLIAVYASGTWLAVEILD